MRALALAALIALATAAFAAAPKPVAPDSIAHPTALFLASLSKDGKQKVSYKAAANGRRFFLEETAGVTVYAFDDAGGTYKRETFLKGYTLAKAMKKYGVK